MTQPRRTPLPYHYSKQHGVVLLPPENAEAAGAQNETPTTAYACLYAERPHIQVMAEIQRFTRYQVTFEQVSPEALQRTVTRLYQDQSEVASQMSESFGQDIDLQALSQDVAQTHDLLSAQDDAPIIRLLNAVLTEAVNANASDLHIETFKDTLSIRFRVDGVLRHALTPPRHVAQSLVSRVKVMSQLDIAEKRIPQDGRMAVHVAGKLIDIRISTLPTNHGERIVLRLLEKHVERLNLEHLGTTPEQATKLKSLLAAPYGILLVTGPTGSGKTTTLYAALSHLNDGSRSILTIEDPVEYDLEGIGQSQVNQKIDMSFARGLRAILRQDPDIVMVGEIRDKETAEIAIQASMTGHLVLSTLHTNTAIGAIARLLDIGIEPFLLSSSLVGVVSQRLVRVLCPECKTAYTPDEHEKAVLMGSQLGDIQFHRANGCAACHNTGYRGRTALYEIITIDSELRRHIHSGESESVITQAAHQRTKSIHQDGLEKVLAGITTLEEVLRVTAANPTDNE